MFPRTCPLSGICVPVCVHTLAHFVPADNISMLIQGKKKKGVDVGGVFGACVDKCVSALMKDKQLRKRSTCLFLLVVVCFYFSRAREESRAKLPSFQPSTPHIHIDLSSLLSPSFSLSLRALNRIRASYAKWNVWRKPQPWNKAQETGRDRDGETHWERKRYAFWRM